MEGPDPDGGDIGESKLVGSGLAQWMRGQLLRNPSVSSMAHNDKRSDLRLLLGVMGAPLAPPSTSAPHLSIKDTPINTAEKKLSVCNDKHHNISRNKRSKVTLQDIQVLYMNRDEVVNTLLDRASIEPGFTNLVWQKLEEENAEFFKACHIRLKLKNQIYMYIQLLEQQYHLIKEQAPTNVAIAPVQIGMQHMTVNNLPMGYSIMQQPLIPCTRHPQINSMGTTSSCHGIPTPENFLHMQQNCAKELLFKLEDIL